AVNEGLHLGIVGYDGNKPRIREKHLGAVKVGTNPFYNVIERGWVDTRSGEHETLPSHVLQGGDEADDLISRRHPEVHHIDVEALYLRRNRAVVNGIHAEEDGLMHFQPGHGLSAAVLY